MAGLPSNIRKSATSTSTAYWYCTGQPIPNESKFWSAPPLFLEDENIFQKSARVVPILVQFPMEPREPIFELHL